ncbi:MAG: trigger factor [Endomicrobiia bacterium]
MELVKTEIKKIDDCKMKLKIEVDKKLIDKNYEETCKEIQKEAEIPGFRKGSVPLEIIKKRFSETLREKTINKIINETLPKILEEKNINYIANTLKIEKLDFKEDKNMVYEVVLEVEPEVKLKSYKGLKLKKEIRQVTQKDIDKVLNELKEHNAKLVVSEKTNITKEDVNPQSKIFCIVNYKIFSDNKELKNFEGKNVLIDLSKDTLPKGFKEGLIGMSKGEKKILKVEFPVNFPQGELMGKQVDMEVELIGIKEKELPEINDDFAKDLGYKNKEDLISSIKQSLKSELDKETNEKLKKQIYEILIREHNFVLPEIEVKQHYQEIVNSIKQDYLSRGGKEEDFKLNEEQNKNLLKKAEDEIKLKYILKKIIKEEKIELTEELIEKEKGKYLSLYPTKEKEINDYFEKNFYTIASNILEEKIFELIISNAKIKEVDITEK